LVFLALALLAVGAFVFANEPRSSNATTATAATEFNLLPVTASPTPPNLALACPTSAHGAWAWYDVSFGYQLDSPDPVARFDIDYGDGHTYSNSSVDGVFAHRYTTSGTFAVTVTVTTVHGLADTDSCNWQLSLNPSR
jgi:hypothetical protein